MQVSNGLQSEQNWTPLPTSCGHSLKWPTPTKERGSERTGGEPDVIGHDKMTGEYLFYDCSPETPNAAEMFVTTMLGGRPGKRKARIPKVMLSLIEVWQLRHEDVELGKNAFRDQKTWSGPLPGSTFDTVFV